MPLGMELGLSPGDSEKGGGALSPIFSKFLLCPNGWMHQDATWCGGRPQPRGLRKRGRSPLPNFRPMSIVAKRLEFRIKMALDMEVGLGPSHIVLDGEPAPLPKKRAEPPIFGPFLQRAAMLALQALY